MAKGQRKFIASSGGNAGLSMAYVAKKLGADIQIVVPESTSEFMINKIRNNCFFIMLSLILNTISLNRLLI